MIKLIVSDVDGTLIQDQSNQISTEALELIEECHASGIRFAVASGRQYTSLKRLFSNIWEDIYFIPENGNLILYQGEILHRVSFPKELAQELLSYLEQVNGCHIMVSTPFSVYLKPEPEWFLQTMLCGVGYTTTVVDSFAYMLHEDVIKISAYVEEERLEELNEKFHHDWGYSLLVAQAGGRWIDFSLSGKGAAVRRLADDYQIKRDEIMVFGDNYNDEQMFTAAAHSYCMSSADEYLKSKAAYTVDTVEEVIAHFLATGEVSPEK